MIKKILTSIWDDKAEHYSTHVHTEENKETAVRNFTKLITTEGNMFSDNPYDYHLYEHAEYNMVTGEVKAYDKPKLICSGKDIVGQNKED